MKLDKKQPDGKEILGVGKVAEITLYDNITNTKDCEVLTIIKFLGAVKNGKWKKQTETIRNEPDPKCYDGRLVRF